MEKTLNDWARFYALRYFKTTNTVPTKEAMEAFKKSFLNGYYIKINKKPLSSRVSLIDQLDFTAWSNGCALNPEEVKND